MDLKATESLEKSIYFNVFCFSVLCAILIALIGLIKKFISFRTWITGNDVQYISIEKLLPTFQCFHWTIFDTYFISTCVCIYNKKIAITITILVSKPWSHFSNRNFKVWIYGANPFFYHRNIALTLTLAWNLCHTPQTAFSLKFGLTAPFAS